MYYDQNIVCCVQIFMVILFQVFGCWRMIEIKVLYSYKMFFFPTFSITCASNIPFIFISHDYKPMHNWFPGKKLHLKRWVTMFHGRVIDTISIFHLLKIIWIQTVDVITIYQCRIYTNISIRIRKIKNAYTENSSVISW